ncbi:MAG: hypothetical protein R2827_13680 [Bdellovibrionales bacterium]
MDGVGLVFTLGVTSQTLNRVDTENFALIEKVYEQVGLDKFSITIATDSEQFNGEVLTAIAELKKTQGKEIEHGTTAYLFMHDKDISEAKETLLESDVVLFELPIPTVPEFTNEYSSRLFDFMKEQTGYKF